MSRQYQFIILFLLFSFPQVFAGALVANGGNEIESPLISPLSTNTFTVMLENTHASETVNNITPAPFLSTEYSFLGGSYPGVGGSCGISLAPGATCSVILQFAPLSSGDKDDLLKFYYEDFYFPGYQQYTYVKIDGHSASSTTGACPSLTPTITSIDPSALFVNSIETIQVSGTYFTPTTTVAIGSLIVSNFNFIDDRNIEVDVDTGLVPSLNDLTITNDCGSVTEADAIEVGTNDWIDLRLAADYTSATIIRSDRVLSDTRDASYGMQINVQGNDWRKLLRFDGACGDVNGNTFEIIIYRTGTSARVMPGLIASTTILSPYTSNSSHQRAYHVVYNTGGAVARAYGSMRFEGGSSWNQTFTSVSTPAGKYIKYKFNNAGQAGEVVEIWEVDSSFNDIALLGQYTSTKINTPGTTNVCLGLVPYSAGTSDYYVTGIRVY